MNTEEIQKYMLSVAIQKGDMSLIKELYLLFTKEIVQTPQHFKKVDDEVIQTPPHFETDSNSEVSTKFSSLSFRSKIDRVRQILILREEEDEDEENEDEDEDNKEVVANEENKEVVRDENNKEDTISTGFSSSSFKAKMDTISQKLVQPESIPNFYDLSEEEEETEDHIYEILNDRSISKQAKIREIYQLKYDTYSSTWQKIYERMTLVDQEKISKLLYW